jgi:hypothetical protein
MNCNKGNSDADQREFGDCRRRRGRRAAIPAEIVSKAFERETSGTLVAERDPNFTLEA